MDDGPGESPVLRGRPWGQPADQDPDVVVAGGDEKLARAAGERPGALIRWSPATGDLARALGIGDAPSGGLALTIDGLWWQAGDSRDRGSKAHSAIPSLAVNAVILGRAPDRLRYWHGQVPVRIEVDGRERFSGQATTVVIVNGQWVRRAELSPRGHPGDGRAEVQVYALPRSSRRAMRARLPSGSHLPHPSIASWQGSRVLVVADGGLRLEADGQEVSKGTRRLEVRRLEVTVKPALRLLV
ncbi:MAG: hypothetical protein ACRDV9_14625 [Acidimicrobiia bacterium]